MNVISPISPMLQDEHVVAVDLAPLADGVVAERKRFNAFQGRSLSAEDLTGLQVSRMASQAYLHRSVSSGVLNGLDVEATRDTSILVRPGFGLSLQGEDVFVGVGQQFDVTEIPALLPKSDGTPPVLGRFDALKNHTDVIKFHAAVLVAVPVSFISNEASPPNAEKFVPLDPVDDPFAGLMETDGCLFALTPLTLVKPLAPSQVFDPSEPSHQGELAHAVFEEEAQLAAGECHAWEQAGLPLALIGFKPDWSISFIDRSSVVRAGGQQRARSSIGGGPSLALQDARIVQFGEQLGSLQALPDVMASLRDTFHWLPPVGFMPKRLAGFGEADSLFPENFSIKAVPVPDDQAMMLISQCSKLDVIDLDKGEPIEIAYPVPAADYDPRLLLVDSIDEAFDAAINDLSAARNRSLASLELMRDVRRKLVLRKTGKITAVPAGEAPDNAEESTGLFSERRVSVISVLNRHCLFFSEFKLVAEQGDKIYLWVKPQGELKLFQVHVTGSIVSDDESESDFYIDIPFVEKAKAGVALQAPADPDGWTYVELDVSTLMLVNAPSHPEKGALPAVEFSSVEFGVDGGSLLLAELGLKKPSAETLPVLTGTLPGTGYFVPPQQGDGKWPWVWRGELPKLGDDNSGTSLSSDKITVPAYDAFKAKIATLDFLGPEAVRIAGLSIDEIVETLSAQISATNDAIDLGFLTARANTFRVREFMLGSDDASRLLTSPALADVIKQDTSARVTAEQLQNFLVKNRYVATGAG